MTLTRDPYDPSVSCPGTRVTHHSPPTHRMTPFISIEYKTLIYFSATEKLCLYFIPAINE